MRLTPWLLTLALVGCGGGDRVRLGPPPAGPPAGALAVAPVRVSYTPSCDRPAIAAGEEPLGSYSRLTCLRCDGEQRTAGRDLVAPCAECGFTTFATPFLRPLHPALDPAAIGAELRARLAERGGFAQVLDLEPGGDPSLAARAAGAELLLELELTDARCRLVDTNWVHPLKFPIAIVCYVFIFPLLDVPNWFLASELYGLEVEARWRLRALGTGQLVGEGELAPRVVEPFAAFGIGVGGRPWFLLDLVRVPGCLDESDWEVIAAQLRPAAQEDVARAAVLAVEAATR